MKTLFTATPNISSFPTKDEFSSPLLSRFNDSRLSDSSSPKFSRSNFPKSAFTGRNFPRTESGSSTYDVKKNDDELFEARVPLGPDFVNRSDMIKVTLSGRTVTITAKIENVDAKGNKRMSKICKDVTLPNDCDLKSMEANLCGEAMVITAMKMDKGGAEFVSIKDRQQNENKGTNSPWNMDFENAKDREFGNVTSRFLDDTVKEMEKNRNNLRQDRPRSVLTGERPRTATPEERPESSGRISKGKTVRFSDSPGISSRPSKESARSYLNSTLPHTFNINVDHDRYSPKPATNVPSKSADTAVPVKHVPSAKDINVTNTKPESSKKQDDISASCKGVGKMDVDDFILTELEERPKPSNERKLEDGMKKMHIELLSERPSSIPPNEPFEDLGLVEGQCTGQCTGGPLNSIPAKIQESSKPIEESEIIPIQMEADYHVKIDTQASEPKVLPPPPVHVIPQNDTTPDQSFHNIPVNQSFTQPANPETTRQTPVNFQQYPYHPTADFDVHTMGQPMFSPFMHGMPPGPFYGGMVPNYGMFGQPMNQPSFGQPMNQPPFGQQMHQPPFGYPMMPTASPMGGMGIRRGSESSVGSVEIPVEHFDENGNKIK